MNVSAVSRARIRRPPVAVFDAFADADCMSRFWFTRRDGGLIEGETLTWYLGEDEDAYAFDVLVKEVHEPSRIVIEWDDLDGNRTQVTWSLEDTGEGDTILTIEETGYAGSDEAIVRRALDSTGGFNQVIIAAKALLEHDVSLNVVADQA